MALDSSDHGLWDVGDFNMSNNSVMRHGPSVLTANSGKNNVNTVPQRHIYGTRQIIYQGKNQQEATLLETTLRACHPKQTPSLTF
jgi:hypothetical protein